MAKKKKQKVKIVIEKFNIYDLVGTVQHVISRLEAARKEGQE